MTTKAYSENRRLAPSSALLAGCFIIALVTHLNPSELAAQALLYDNTDQSRLYANGSRRLNWIGPQDPSTLFTAMPFHLAGRTSISKVTIPFAANVSSTASGTFDISIWDDNGDGFPGSEVAVVGTIDVSELSKFDFPGGLVPPMLPEFTFQTDISDLSPDETHFLMLDYRGVSNVQFGDVLHGLSNSPDGSSHPGEWLVSLTANTPPFDSNVWQSIRVFQGSNVYFQMAISSAEPPFSSIPCAVGVTYHQNFELGNNGQITTFLPPGWAFSDTARSTSLDGQEFTEQERILAVNERVFDTSITDAFPAASSLGQGTPVFNAGASGDADRALALGVTSTSEDAMFQLVAEVAGGAAKSLQLKFDIEAWDAANSRDNPGEAAFNVALDLDTGDGFQQLIDLGRVTTGPTLIPSTGDFVNGNDDAYRTSFDSGVLNAELPEGSLLRVRWMADTQANTRGWVFGLDNVSLGMFAEPNSVPGDFTGNGTLTSDDVDLLTAEIAAGEPFDTETFDLTGDGIVNDADVAKWLSSAATENGFAEDYLNGDSNLDGSVNAADLNNLALNWQQSINTWSGGDFTADGIVNSGDLNALALNWQQSIAAASPATVPEPSAATLLVFGAVAFIGFRNIQATGSVVCD